MPTEKKLKVLLLEDELDNALVFEMCRDDWDIDRLSHPSKIEIETIDQYDVVFFDMVYNISEDNEDIGPSTYIDSSLMIAAESSIIKILEKDRHKPIVIFSALPLEMIKGNSKIYDLGKDFLYISKPADLSSYEFENSVLNYIKKLGG